MSSGILADKHSDDSSGLVSFRVTEDAAEFWELDDGHEWYEVTLNRDHTVDVEGQWPVELLAKVLKRAAAWDAHGGRPPKKVGAA